MNSYFMCDGHVVNHNRLDLEVAHAEGNFIFDTNGKRYLDLRSGLWNTSLGYDSDLYHNIKLEIDDLMNKKIPFIDIHSYNYKIYNELGEKIISFCKNDMFQAMFTNSGSENTDLCLKIINSIKQEDINILTFSESYHGSFFGGVSVSGIEVNINKHLNKPYQNITYIDFPKNREDEKASLEYISKIMSTIDVFFIEPILSSAGIFSSSIDYLNKVLKIAEKENVITVFDEVSTGFYRTGTALYSNQLDYNPDIICLSKSINNGISPFGCVCINKKIFNLLKGKPIHHFSTQNGNLISAISANIVLDYYINNGDFLREKTATLKNIFLETMVENKIPSNLYRACEGMMALDTPNSDPYLLQKKLANLGILTYMYNSKNRGISLFPQYNISQETFKKAISLIVKIIY